MEIIIGALIVVATCVILTRLYMKHTTKMCESDASMDGKVVIVTGANTGLGLETARDLAKRGARVILACRDETRALRARDQIIASTGNTDVVFRKLNLSSLASVREFAEITLKTETQLDVLVNNAGIQGLHDRYTEDNIVEEMQINHFGPFLLTLLLLPLLKKSAPSRIVNVSSILHNMGEIDLKRINKLGHYNEFEVYNNSKLCNVLFSARLAKLLEGTGVVSNSLHPGVIYTNITAQSPFLNRFIFIVWTWVCCRTVVEGAQTSIYLAVAEECESVSGKYFSDCAEKAPSLKAKDRQLASDLWHYSEKLVDYYYKE